MSSVRNPVLNYIGRSRIFVCIFSHNRRHGVQWANISEKVPELPTVTPSRPREFPFLALDDSPKFLKAKSGDYWEHLTIESLKVYERVYELCKDPGTGQVSCESRMRILLILKDPEPCEVQYLLTKFFLS